MPIDSADLVQDTERGGCVRFPDPSPTPYARLGTLYAAKIDGPFVVRGQLAVIAIEDGWMVQGEDGNLFGVEDSQFQRHFTTLTHTITVSAGANGAITSASDTVAIVDGVATVAHGDTVAFAITPSEGFVVDVVLADGVPVTIEDSQYVFQTVVVNHTLSATFVGA